MGQLADRLRDVLREYGWAPAARDAELSALADLETRDPKAAHARFLDLRRAYATRHRADLLTRLRTHAFVLDVPTHDATGMSLKEIEAEARAAERAHAHARAIQTALAEEAEARAATRQRPLPPTAPLPAAPWNALAPLADAAEVKRRIAAREARVEARARDAQRRAAKLRTLHVDVPPTSHLPADEADAKLTHMEDALRAAEALEAAHDAATRPLRDPAVAQWARDSRRALQREADAALQRRDADALQRLRAQAHALHAEAAKKAEAAARARRRGQRGPERERRAGDAMDGYG